MEKGHLRCDANVSVRPWGQEKLGTKVEVKNLNSFRFLREAIDYEIARQVAVIEGGGKIHQESRLFNPDTGVTASMRSKEDAHDYRYFPEPDLAPLRIGEAWLQSIKASVPELPGARRTRFVTTLGLSEYDAQVLTASRGLADYFEAAAKVGGDAKITANWVMGDLAALLKNAGLEIEASPVSAQNLGELVALITSGALTGKLAKDVLPKMFGSGEAAAAIVEREGLKTISDTGELERIIDEVIAGNPKQLEQYKGGKVTLAGFFVGQVMKASRGQANPAVVNDLVKAKLDKV
jgi:aspartyl-tRNA(Asn)/glutamyl-tRNA(Gln) amidotransferase subunit B